MTPADRATEGLLDQRRDGATSGGAPWLVERLRVVAVEASALVELRRREDPRSQLVFTFAPSSSVIVLDAAWVERDGSAPYVLTSEFDAIVQRGCVVRRTPTAPEHPPCVLFVGMEGSVLWWIRTRGGALFVRDVRSGTSYPIDPSRSGIEPRSVPRFAG